MIIKNLSRKNGNSGQLVKYILRYVFRDKEDYAEERSVVRTKSGPMLIKGDFFSPYNVPKGIWLNRRDWRFLRAEHTDRLISNDFVTKYPNYDYQAYIQNYLLPPEMRPVIKDKESGDLQPFVITHNMGKANSIKEFVRMFEDNERNRIHKRVDQTTIHHTIISWSNKDREQITEAMLRDITREYIRLRGENNIYCGTPHMDRGHIHLHLSMSATSLDGKSSRISQKEFEEIKVKLQEYQMLRYPSELKHSLPVHGRAKMEKSKEATKQKYIAERSSYKEKLQQTVESNYNKATSVEHFISLLGEQGYTVYSRYGKLTGIQSNEFKFRFSNLSIDLEQLRQMDRRNEKESDRRIDIQEQAGVPIPQSKDEQFEEQQAKTEKEIEQALLDELESLRSDYHDRDYDLDDDDRDYPTDTVQDEETDEDGTNEEHTSSTIEDELENDNDSA